MMGPRRTLSVLAICLCSLLVPLAQQAALAQQGGPALPEAADWRRHFERDILPFWTTPSALGNPVGNFPTFRCNNGFEFSPRFPCEEFAQAPLTNPTSETLHLSAVA